ncbi:MAG: sugar phosphate nucleotidyltransferase [Candidatus Electryoneaceae bacterium]|nr:sugar phosphate nucleotidyltransferase [Candidatus Electryoneaceae bacterium]
MAPIVERGVSAIGVKEVDDPRKFGVVLLENGLVKKLIEKPSDPPTNLAIIGIYYIRDGGMLMRAVQETIDKNITVKGEYQVTDALQILVDWGEPMETIPVEGWYDCGRPETLLATNRYILDRSNRKVSTDMSDKNVIIPPVFIGEDVRIERAIIGPHASIGNGSILRDVVVRNSIIGDDTLIERIMLEGALIGDRSVVQGRFHRLNISTSSEIKL